jgi:hypothetical protein
MEETSAERPAAPRKLSRRPGGGDSEAALSLDCGARLTVLASAAVLASKAGSASEAFLAPEALLASATVLASEAVLIAEADLLCVLA